MKWTLCLMLLLLTSCAAFGHANNVRDYCQLASPITLDSGDNFSATTARQIFKHNRTHQKICGMTKEV